MLQANRFFTVKMRLKGKLQQVSVPVEKMFLIVATKSGRVQKSVPKTI